MHEPYIQHSEIDSFAQQKVNIPHETLVEYRAQVTYLRDTLTKYIKDHPHYDLAKILHSGSAAKGTALKTLNDMDVAVYVKKIKDNLDESTLLDWLIARLKEVYPTMDPDQFSKGGHCVKISYKTSGLDVDVSPVIYEDDKDNRGYLINKDTGDRVLTSISLHLQFIRDRKKKVPKHFRQVIRLIKWWIATKKKEDENFRFKSFMAELICAHLLDTGADMSDYVKAMEQFFLYILKSGLKEKIFFTDNYQAKMIPAKSNAVIQIYDPVNPDNNVAAQYNEADRLKIVEAAHAALDAIHEARFANTKGRSVECWQRVFGPSFNA